MSTEARMIAAVGAGMASAVAAALDPRDRLRFLRDRYVRGEITLERFEADLPALLKQIPWR